MPITTQINERSWAIDMITEICNFSRSRDLVIKRAGGERSLNIGKKTLFPDVIIYGDESSSLILQGWELKMPDTDINDTEFISNAETKANNLGLKSFVLWNGKIAKLFVKNGLTFNEFHNWGELPHINTREDVTNNDEEIKRYLYIMIEDLSRFFSTGTIPRSNFIDSVTSVAINSIILSNQTLYAESLESASTTDSTLRREIDNWWLESKKEYQQTNTNENKYQILARLNITQILNKIVYANALLHRYSGITGALAIVENSLDQEAGLTALENISATCDHWLIFHRQLGDKYIPQETWETITNFAQLIKDSQIYEMEADLLHELQEVLILRSKRKFAGQFTTPVELAEFLAELSIRDYHETVMDPCCGTGTIAKVVIEQKKSRNINNSDAISSTWASDKFQFPLHLAVFALDNPSNTDQVLQVFQEDAMNLETGLDIKLHDPFTGEVIHKSLPKIDTIISNLPFVQASDISALNPKINAISEEVLENTGIRLSDRGDLYSYLPFTLHKNLSQGGILGIIISNSYLSTDWGEDFLTALRRYYNILYIVNTESERWFKNAKVVANILLLSKKETDADQDIQTKYITITKKLTDLKERNELGLVASRIHSVHESNDYYHYNYYSPEEIASLAEIGLQGNAFFGNINWMQDIKQYLIPASEEFSITRGSRRGWDAMFIPTEVNLIDEEYLKPMLKNSRSITKLIANPQDKAFCCLESKEELIKKQKVKTLKWIERFESLLNGVGKPLPQALANPSEPFWYSLSPYTMADYVTSLNPGDRHFIAKMNTPAFANQRLICFKILNAESNNDLMHAILNTSLTYLYIEALGFGRGEGVLDLSSDKIKNNLRILDPKKIDPTKIEVILTKFGNLVQRDIKTIDQELLSEDRIDFEKTLYSAVGIETKMDDIHKSLLKLYNLRQAVVR